MICSMVSTSGATKWTRGRLYSLSVWPEGGVSEAGDRGRDSGGGYKAMASPAGSFADYDFDSAFYLMVDIPDARVAQLQAFNLANNMHLKAWEKYTIQLHVMK